MKLRLALAVLALCVLNREAGAQTNFNTWVSGLSTATTPGSSDYYALVQGGTSKHVLGTSLLYAPNNLSDLSSALTARSNLGNVPTAPGTTTSSDVAAFNSTTGAALLDTGVLYTNLVTASSTLTSNAIVLGAGSKSLSVLSTLGTTTTVLHGNASGVPSYGPVSLTTDVSGTLPVANGGIGTGTAGGTAVDNISAFGSLSPSTGALTRNGAASYSFMPYGSTGNNTLVETGSGGLIVNSLISGLPFANLATLGAYATGTVHILANASGSVASPADTSLTAGTNTTLTCTTGPNVCTIAATGGGGGGSGTVNSGTGGQGVYYPATGTAVSGTSGLTLSSTQLTGMAIGLGSDGIGDTYYRNSSGNLARLGIGSSGNFLTVSGGLPAWVASVPAASLSGTLQAAQFPILTGDVTTVGSSLATTVGKVNGVSYPAAPATGTVPEVTSANTITYTSLASIFAAPGPIGSTTPSTGAFSTLSTTGNTTLGGTLTAASLAAPSGNVAGSICATSGGSILYQVGSNCYAAGSTTFSTLTSGTNTTMAAVVGSGASLTTTGTGSIVATAAPISGVTGLGTGVATALGNPLGGTGGLNGTVTWPTTGYAMIAGGNAPTGIAPIAGSVLYGAAGPAWASTALNTLAVTALSGTAGQINVSASVGSITVSLPATITQAETFSATTTHSAQLSSTAADTIASGASATLDDVNVASETTTIIGTNTIATSKGFNKASIYAPTITATSPVTVTNAASLYVDAAPIAAGSVTITNPYTIRVGSGNVSFPGTANVLGTITSGTWNGGLIGLTYGGTGANLSGTGPGVLQQMGTGSTVTVAPLAAASLSNGTSGSGAVALVNGAVFTAPNLGTPASISLNNATNLPFSSLISATNTAAAMVIGSGASLTTSGIGSITATAVPASGLTGTALPGGITGSALTTFGTSPTLAGTTTFTGTDTTTQVQVAPVAGATQHITLSGGVAQGVGTPLPALISTTGLWIQVASSSTNSIGLFNGSTAMVNFGIGGTTFFAPIAYNSLPTGTAAGAACFTSAGTLVYATGANCFAGSGGVSSPGTTATNDVVAWGNTTGTSITDSGILYTNLVTINTAQTIAALKTFSSPPAITSGGLPTQAAGLLGLGGEVTVPTLGANGEADVYITSTTGGITLIGKGSTNDFTLLNSGGTSACTLATGLTVFRCATLAATGTALPTQVSGTLGLGGVLAAAPTMNATGEGDVFLTTAGGLNLIGDGTNDFTLLNHSGTSVCTVLGAATTLNCTGLAQNNVGVLTGSGAANGIIATQTLPATTGTITPQNPVGQQTNYAVTLTGNATVAFPATVVANQNMQFQISESSGGGNTIALASGYTFLTGTPGFNTVANAVNVVSCYATSSTTAYCAYYAPSLTAATLTANAIPKASGASALANSSLTDNGTVVNTTEPIEVAGAKLPTSQPISIGWGTGQNPARVPIISDIPVAITITQINGRLEVAEGTAETVDVYAASPGQPCTLANIANLTKLDTTASLNLNSTAPNVQVLLSAGSISIAASSSICLVPSSGATFTNNIAGVSIFANPT